LFSGFLEGKYIFSVSYEDDLPFRAIILFSDPKDTKIPTFGGKIITGYSDSHDNDDEM
jgi:hypothetical protein